MSDALAQFRDDLQAVGYVAERDLASTLDLAVQMRKPLLLEGDAGVGKTEVAKALSRLYGCPLIRLQCYEGLDTNAAVYEWNYQHQLMAIKLQENQHRSAVEAEQHIFSRTYLLERPLLQAISQPESPVLLVDEIDRADEEFEAYLLEVLSDFQISIPELGTVQATSLPYVILTSNGTRELSDALRRRCLYHYVDFPSFDKELNIVLTRLPDVSQRLAGQIVGYVQGLRKLDLRKHPGIAETLDWAAALLNRKVDTLRDDPEAVRDSLACLLKTREDREALAPEVSDRLVARAS
jgi:MoxR-like ATPase